jgi:integrase
MNCGPFWLERGVIHFSEPHTSGGLIQTAAATAGITKRVYPHLLRHSYATWYQQNGGNPILLAQQLGHSSLRMIQTTYSHLTPWDAYAEMLRVFAESRGSRLPTGLSHACYTPV